MRPDLYKQVRKSQQVKTRRLVIDLPELDVEAFDRWAVEHGFPTRAKALRKMIAEHIGQERMV